MAIMSKMIGLDIGGTKCAVIIGEANGINEENELHILNKASFLTETEKGFSYTFNKICQSIQDIIDKNDAAGTIASIGISCGGPLDSKRGFILSPPNLIGWDKIPIVRLLQDRFGINASLQNDANACALAEWKYGAAKGCNNVIFLTFGTGMGAGLILDGRLYSGTNDMAGEIGHVRLADNGPVGYGKAGSFEGFCSGGGISQLARTMVLEKLQSGEKVSFCNSVDDLGGLTAKSVGEAARTGDGLALEIYRVCGQYLGKGVSILIDMLNPEIIVIGSVFARQKNFLYDAAMEIIEKETLSQSRNVCRIVPAELGEHIGDYAALAVAGYWLGIKAGKGLSL